MLRATCSDRRDSSPPCGPAAEVAFHFIWQSTGINQIESEHVSSCPSFKQDLTKKKFGHFFDGCDELKGARGVSADRDKDKRKGKRAVSNVNCKLKNNLKTFRSISSRVLPLPIPLSFVLFVVLEQ